MDTPTAFDRTALDRLLRIGGAGLVAQMIALFREAAAARLQEARVAAAGGDLRGVGRAAHALVSSAGNVGAAELMAAARALEAAAADSAEATDALARVEDAYARLAAPLAAYERELPA